MDTVKCVDEVWKAIPHFEGKYEVSNLGNVRSLDRVVSYVKASGSAASTRFKGKVLTQRVNKLDGQLYVMLSDDGRQKSMQVARLVAAAFIGIDDITQYVYHKDGNNRNNRWDNLKLGVRNGGKSIKLRSATTGVVYKSIGEVGRRHSMTDYLVKQHVLNHEPIDGELYEFITPEE